MTCNHVDGVTLKNDVYQCNSGCGHVWDSLRSWARTLGDSFPAEPLCHVCNHIFKDHKNGGECTVQEKRFSYCECHSYRAPKNA